MSKLVITKQQNDYWSFVLDENTDNEISNTRNDLLTIGNECHFKTANGANLIQQQNIQPTDITIIGSTTYNPTDTHQLFNVLIGEGYFAWITAQAGTGGKDRFDELLDTFPYIGKDGMCVVVDETQLRLIAVPFYNVSKSTDLSDMPSAIAGNQMLVTSPDGTKYQYAPLPALPETFLNTVGFFVYDDAATRAVPMSFSANVETKLTNDSQGTATNLTQTPFGIAKLWDSDLNQIDFSELSLGDIVTLRLAIEPTTTVPNQNWQIILKLGISSPVPLRMVIFNHNTKPAGLEPQTFDIQFGIGDVNIKDYPAELYILSDGNGTITTGVLYFGILRKNINIVEIGAEGLDLKEDKVNKRPIIGNETNLITYPSTKDVVDYVAAFGAADLQSVLLKGNTANQPLLLQMASDSYISFYHPTFESNGFQSLLQFNSGAGIFSNLYLHWIPQAYDVQIQQQTAIDLSVSSLGIRPNGSWLKTFYETLSDGSYTEYTVMTEGNDILFQKRTNTITRKFRIKLDSLSNDRTAQMPDGDGTIAYQSYVDGKLTSLTTDSVAEGINPSRLYFASSRVLATLLAGLITTTGGAILTTDTILQAFGKLQYQINNVITSSGIITALGYTPESVDNKLLNAFGGQESSTVKYPSAKAFTTWIVNTFSGFLGTKSTIIDTDNIFISDSANLFITTKITFANFKNALGSVFQPALGYTAENTTNKTSILNTFETSTQGYPNNKGVVDWVTNFALLWFSNKTTIVDTDYVAISDSADSFKAKKILWSNFKNALKTFTDTIYQPVLVSATNIRTIGMESILGSGNIPASIKITSAVDINTSTKSDTGNWMQNNKMVIISNTAQINYVWDAAITCTIMKVGSLPIVFQQGSGRSLIVEGKALASYTLDGNIGSQASLISDGTVDYLNVTNYY